MSRLPCLTVSLVWQDDGALGDKELARRSPWKVPIRGLNQAARLRAVVCLPAIVCWGERSAFILKSFACLHHEKASVLVASKHDEVEVSVTPTYECLPAQSSGVVRRAVPVESRVQYL